MGIYTEKPISPWMGVLILLIAFLAIHEPWLLGMRELFRQEGFYAVQAVELQPSSTLVTAHGVPIQDAFPLYPALSGLLMRGFGVPAEFALRTVSLLMLAATAVLTYFAAASERSCRAGLVAAGMYISTFLVLEKACDGDPATSNAFFLLAAQLLFFQYGIRRTNWNAAWISSLALLGFGFFSGGFRVLLYFVFPMFFFRRPLSVKSKFRKPGFAIGVALLAVCILAWSIPYLKIMHHTQLLHIRFEDFTPGGWLQEVALFPLMLPLRLLPWSLIAWIPFCVALQALDSTPILSRYLRTLVFASLALLWLLPDGDPVELLYLLGPLSILVGINYELGMRRYGFKIRKALILCSAFAVVAALSVGVVCFVPQEWLTPFLSLSNSLDFAASAGYRGWAAVAVLVLLYIAWRLYRGRSARPVWIMLLATSAAAGIFCGAVLTPYRAQADDKREFGRSFRNALRGEPAEKLYKRSLEFQPDIVLIMLGSNDSKPNNWNAESYACSMTELSRSYTSLASRPRVLLMTPPSVFHFWKKVLWTIQGDVLENEVVPICRRVAEELGLECVDVHGAFLGKKELFVDGCHPNVPGARLLAETVYQAIKEPAE